MAKAIDLTGQQFSHLTVRERAGSSKAGGALWRCECLCGNETLARASDLRNGSSKSCGCLLKAYQTSPVRNAMTSSTRNSIDAQRSELRSDGIPRVMLEMVTRPL